MLGGSLVVLLAGLLRSRVVRETIVPLLTVAVLGAALGLTIWQWDANASIIAGALRVDDLALALNGVFLVAAAATTVLGWRALAPREAAHGEWFSLVLASAGGMLVLVEAQNLVTLFLGLELLSIPLYVLCASELRRATSLESGLKYLVIGSVGSATLLYGLAFIYGATGSTDLSGIAGALGKTQTTLTDPLFLTGMALVVTGLGFKASVAPFHQWTPDVYEGAPTPITAFMATATKAAALGVFLRLFDVALIDAQRAGDDRRVGVPLPDGQPERRAEDGHRQQRHDRLADHPRAHEPDDQHDDRAGERRQDRRQRCPVDVGAFDGGGSDHGCSSANVAPWARACSAAAAGRIEPLVDCSPRLRATCG